MIKIQNLNKGFDEKTIIQNLNLDIEKNNITCLFSESGTGKTTFLKILSGLIKSDDGSVSNVSSVSVTFQEDRLLPWLTASQNIEIVSSKEKAERLLKEVVLEDKADKYPNELSGGMCRRVALARSLAHESDTLILDEPFKGLDQKLKTKMFELILSFREKRTIIITSHDVSDVAYLADRVLCFSNVGFNVLKDIEFDTPQLNRDEKIIKKYIDEIIN